MPRDGKKQRGRKGPNSQLMTFIERFNIQFLGSNEVTKPPQASFSTAKLEEALKQVLSKQRPCHAGTITITQQGIKWVKSGMYNGALYGINRVLFSGAHDSGPYFSFIVKDKTADRFICHCFACDNRAQAGGINAAIGEVFALIAEEKNKRTRYSISEASCNVSFQDGGMQQVTERSRKFEESRLLAGQGNLLSTPLDRGEGVDADEAMAVLDAGFDSTGWSTPAVANGRVSLSSDAGLQPPTLPHFPDSLVRQSSGPNHSGIGPTYFCTKCGTRNSREACSKCGALRRPRSDSTCSGASSSHSTGSHGTTVAASVPASMANNPFAIPPTVPTATSQPQPPRSATENNPFLSPAIAPPPTTNFFCTKCGARNTGGACTSCGAVRDQPTGRQIDTVAPTEPMYEEDTESPVFVSPPPAASQSDAPASRPMVASPQAPIAPLQAQNAAEPSAPHDVLGSADDSSSEYGEPTPDVTDVEALNELSRAGSVVYGESENLLAERRGSVEYGEDAAIEPTNPFTMPLDTSDGTETIQFADHPFSTGGFGEETMSAENAEQLWQSESAALEEAMRLIRERLEQDVPEVGGAQEELLPVQLSDLVSPTPIASNPFAALAATMPVPANSGTVVKELTESIGGLTDLILDYQRITVNGLVDLRSEQTVEPEIKMCLDSDMQAPRASLTVSGLRPGASGFNIRVQVIQHICYLDTNDAGKIVEWLVGDETGVCCLKTTEPVGDKLHLGIWYDLLGAQVDLVSGGYMRLVIGYYGGTRIVKSSDKIQASVFSNNVSAVPVSL